LQTISGPVSRYCEHQRVEPRRRRVGGCVGRIVHGHNGESPEAVGFPVPMLVFARCGMVHTTVHLKRIMGRFSQMLASLGTPKLITVSTLSSLRSIVTNQVWCDMQGCSFCNQTFMGSDMLRLVNHDGFALACDRCVREGSRKRRRFSKLPKRTSDVANQLFFNFDNTNEKSPLAATNELDRRL
jgi:hypothetical protein